MHRLNELNRHVICLDLLLITIQCMGMIIWLWQPFGNRIETSHNPMQFHQSCLIMTLVLLPMPSKPHCSISFSIQSLLPTVLLYDHIYLLKCCGTYYISVKRSMRQLLKCGYYVPQSSRMIHRRIKLYLLSMNYTYCLLSNYTSSFILLFHCDWS